jgi:pyruvate kinase
VEVYEDASDTGAGRPELHGEIPFPHPEILGSVRAGNRLLLDDGNIELEVLEVEPPRMRCRVEVGGVLTSNKGVNLPGVDIDISALTDKDRADADLAVELGLDYLALSFVRSHTDIEELREYIEGAPSESADAHLGERKPGENPHRVPSIVAKIEKPEALDDLERIVLASDAVMVARGDLGVEISPEQVPVAQKKIIRMCNRMGKPVITATQMLQSMIDAPRPTRAEASDVANAILDGSDAVMLSGETSVGSYPVEAVAFMKKIAVQVEQSAAFSYHRLMGMEEVHGKHSDEAAISQAVSRVTVDIAEECSAAAIVTSTESGRTARTVARHRPSSTLLVVTPFEETARRMQLVWGARPVVVDAFENTDKMIKMMVKACTKEGVAAVGDRVILTAGIPFEVHGVTNMLKVHTIRPEDVED